MGKFIFDKVSHLATVISQIGTDVNPDGPGNNRCCRNKKMIRYLTDLIRSPLLSQRHYKMVHYDSRDFRGIDVAFLYNPKIFTVLNSKKLYVRLPFGAKQSVLYARYFMG